MGHKLLFFFVKDTFVETFEKMIILYISLASVGGGLCSTAVST